MTRGCLQFLDFAEQMRLSHTAKRPQTPGMTFTLFDKECRLLIGRSGRRGGSLLSFPLCPHTRPMTTLQLSTRPWSFHLTRNHPQSSPSLSTTRPLLSVPSSRRAKLSECHSRRSGDIRPRQTSTPTCTRRRAEDRLGRRAIHSTTARIACRLRVNLILESLLPAANTGAGGRREA